jgi:hypothetical protein
MRDQLGMPLGPAEDRAFGEEYLRLYSRRCEGGIVFLNYTGKTLRIPLSSSYFDRAGHSITSLTLPDLHGDYVLKAPGSRAPRPRILPVISGAVSGPVTVSVAPMDGATARCTPDGSEPRPDSPPCRETMQLQAGMQLRAKAFMPGKRPSFTSSPAFELQHQLPEVSICGSTHGYALICLSHASGRSVTVPWTVDGEAAPGEAVFQPGERYQCVALPIYRSLTLGQPSGATLGRNRSTQSHE